MAFTNLPATHTYLLDGNLQVASVNENPIVMVLGTSPSGNSETVYSVSSVSKAAKEFGRTDGTLVKGLYEVVSGGAKNIKLFRIGATAASLSGIGAGVTITTVTKDASAGTDYEIFWDDSDARLRVWRASDDVLVYDNNPAYPSGAVDEHEVSVAGTWTISTNVDIGTITVPVTLAAANGTGSAIYTAGTDGLTMGRMKLFEALYSAYMLLANEDIDIVAPQNIYLDDLNVWDMTTAEVAAINIASCPWFATSVYPTAGTAFDVLGEVFAQEYEGQWYFWWDLDRDNVAEIYPTVGLSTNGTTDAFGTTLSSVDFHQANFGYQLANFCYQQSENTAEMFGVIGMLPPDSWSLKDISNWIGRVPIFSDDDYGNSVISTNGTGLLGNKWNTGKKSMSGTGIPGHFIAGTDGLHFGGFIGTDDGWPDGSQEYDDNDHLIDIGKYIDVIPAQVILSNPSSEVSYIGTAASVCAGMLSSLPGNTSMTNKIIPGVRLPFRIAVSKIDTLAGYGYTMLMTKNKGIVVADNPSAARPDSDYRRRSTFVIVKAAVDTVRAAAEPFLGNPISGARLAALENAINQGLGRLQKQEYLQRFQALVTATPTQQVQGKADCELLLVPAYELRQLSVNVSLAAQ